MSVREHPRTKESAYPMFNEYSYEYLAKHLGYAPGSLRNLKHGQVLLSPKFISWCSLRLQRTIAELFGEDVARQFVEAQLEEDSDG